MTDDDTMLREATTCANAALIADIVGHPADEPAVDDLVGGTDLSTEAVRRRLDDLLDVDVVDWTDRGVCLTSAARSLFDERGLFPERVWKRQYDQSGRSDGDDRLVNTCRRCGDAVFAEDDVVLVSWDRFHGSEKVGSGRATFCADCVPIPAADGPSDGR